MARRNGGFIGTDGLDAPDPPTGVAAEAGSAAATISFTAPTDVGTSAITGFIATADDGSGAAGSSSPITVSSLTNGTAYTFRVYAKNAYGTSSASDATDSITPSSTRALFGGSSNNTGGNVIDFFIIETLADATDFGDLSSNRTKLSALGSATRGVFVGGDDVDTMEYVTIASAGNVTDFGNLTAAKGYPGTLSNATRGIIHGGYYQSRTNVIEYITIANTGNGTDFGDLTAAVSSSYGCGSTTRGIMSEAGVSGFTNVISYITIANTGNASDFGDQTVSKVGRGALSSSTRGVFTSGFQTNVIDYVTIASTGDATDFGDAQASFQTRDFSASNKTRGIMCESTSSKNINYITIATTGNSVDFADLSVARQQGGALSSGHGGIA